MQLALVTHPLLDALTVYGTQLWWPLPPSPTRWSSVFIIDPLYTLPLLVAGVAAFRQGWRPPARRALAWGLALSTAYLGWSLLAKALVEHEAEAALAARGLSAVARLQWFNRGFMKAEQRDGALVLTDLRMGSEPDYVFAFVVAERAGEGWREVLPRQLAPPWQAQRRLGEAFRRIWTAPPGQAAAATSQATPADSASK